MASGKEGSWAPSAGHMASLGFGARHWVGIQDGTEGPRGQGTPHVATVQSPRRGCQVSFWGERASQQTHCKMLGAQRSAWAAG